MRKDTDVSGASPETSDNRSFLEARKRYRRPLWQRTVYTTNSISFYYFFITAKIRRNLRRIIFYSNHQNSRQKFGSSNHARLRCRLWRASARLHPSPYPARFLLHFLSWILKIAIISWCISQHDVSEHPFYMPVLVYWAELSIAGYCFPLGCCRFWGLNPLHARSHSASNHCSY